jgi:hypothetical protein
MCVLIALPVPACSTAAGSHVESDGAAAPPAVVQNADGTIDFVPSLVQATRDPAACAVQSPPFAAGDEFFFTIDGNAAHEPPNQMVISFYGPPAFTVGTPVALTVQAYASQGTKIFMPDGGFALYADQSAYNSTLSFAYTQGSDPSEIDEGPFDAVTLTVIAMPTADDEPMTIRVYVRFADGKALDDTFSSRLETTFSPCVPVDPDISNPDAGYESDAGAT